jgi:hypothetical protein
LESSVQVLHPTGLTLYPFCLMKYIPLFEQSSETMGRAEFGEQKAKGDCRIGVLRRFKLLFLYPKERD